MATFQNLKNDRNVRLASTSSNPTQLEITALISTPLLPLPLENQNQETFSDLNGLKVHQSDSRLGRTLHSDKNYVGGRVLMTTTPLVSVLDNKNIKNYCFTCHKEGELTRCSGCQFIYYCSPVSNIPLQPETY